MNRIRNFFGWLFCSNLPQSFRVLAAQRLPRQSTRNLYLLRVDFPMTSDKAQDLRAGLEPLQAKFGLTFIGS